MNQDRVWNIRPAKMQDAPQVAEIWLELGWLPELTEMGAGRLEAMVSRQLEACLGNPVHQVLAAEGPDGIMVGYLSVHWLPNLYLEGGEGYVSELFVAGRVRGRKVGRTLLNKARDLARQRGCKRLMLLNGKHRQSYQRGFYSSLGWIERPEVANFALPVEEE